MAICFDVLGTPKPQGSKRAFMAGGRAVVKESNSLAHAQWRNAVADTARRAADEHGALDGAVMVTVAFRFPMPKSRPKAMRALDVAPMTVAPDVDKLQRALFDGLQAGGLIRNDSQIYSVVAYKYEVTGWTGAEVTLTSFDEIASHER